MSTRSNWERSNALLLERDRQVAENLDREKTGPAHLISSHLMQEMRNKS